MYYVLYTVCSTNFDNDISDFLSCTITAAAVGGLTLYRVGRGVTHADVVTKQ